jgi:hypothetical protein
VKGGYCLIKSPIYTFRGFFHGYGIDEYGNIYNSKGKMAWHINENGYATIALRRDKKSYYFKVHRLVILNFGILVLFKTDVNHKDGNKLNNHISNLEWATRSENLKHAYDHNLKVAKPRYGMKNPNGKSAFMWIKKEQIEKEYQELYINVQCMNAGCKYKIRINGYQSVVFEP